MAKAVDMAKKLDRVNDTVALKRMSPSDQQLTMEAYERTLAGKAMPADAQYVNASQAAADAAWIIDEAAQTTEDRRSSGPLSDRHRQATIDLYNAHSITPELVMKAYLWNSLPADAAQDTLTELQIDDPGFDPEAILALVNSPQASQMLKQEAAAAQQRAADIRSTVADDPLLFYRA
jgi:hypothetical protein